MEESAPFNAPEPQIHDSFSEADLDKPPPWPDLNNSLKRKAEINTQGS